MKLENIRKGLEITLKKTRTNIKEVTPMELIGNMAILRQMVNSADKWLDEMRDLIARKIMDVEMETMKQEAGKINFMKLMERLEKIPFFKEFSEKAEKDIKNELYEHVIKGGMTLLCYYRTIKHLSQEELAEKVGTTQSAVARAEKPKYNMTLRTARKYAKALDIDPKGLIIR